MFSVAVPGTCRWRTRYCWWPHAGVRTSHCGRQRRCSASRSLPRIALSITVNVVHRRARARVEYALPRLRLQDSKTGATSDSGAPEFTRPGSASPGFTIPPSRDELAPVDSEDVPSIRRCDPIRRKGDGHDSVAAHRLDVAMDLARHRDLHRVDRSGGTAQRTARTPSSCRSETTAGPQRQRTEPRRCRETARHLPNEPLHSATQALGQTSLASQ